MKGLVLTAGGARGAYQAGVLKRVGEIPRLRGRASPFSIVTGASAGALNGAAMASGSEDFYQATRDIAKLWSDIRAQDVYHTDSMALGKGIVRWIRDLCFGGMWGGGNVQSLLDFSPLRKYLTQNLSFDGISRSIEKKSLYALAVSATNYYSGKSFTFIQGQTGHPVWEKSRRISVPVAIDVDHIWASCAIPVVFQPVLIRSAVGDYYFGDGGLRLTTPLSPAIRLGADHVFAIGIRSQKSAEIRLQTELGEKGEGKFKMKKPPLAQVFGVALNSIFLDHLDTDLEHLIRMNNLLLTNQIDLKQMKEPMRVVKPFSVHPSVDLAAVAEQYEHRMPSMVRYMMEGLGTSKAQSADLSSYLLFDSEFTKALVDIGYHDAEGQMAGIEEFLLG